MANPTIFSCKTDPKNFNSSGFVRFFNTDFKGCPQTASPPPLELSISNDENQTLNITFSNGASATFDFNDGFRDLGTFGLLPENPQFNGQTVTVTLVLLPPKGIDPEWKNGDRYDFTINLNKNASVEFTRPKRGTLTPNPLQQSTIQ